MLVLVLMPLAAEIALGVVTLEEGAAVANAAVVRLQPLQPMTRALARPIRKRPRL